MRCALLAAAITLSFAATASAGPWTDPAGRIVFEAPENWIVAPQPGQDFTYVIAGGGMSECHVFATPQPATAAADADLVQAAGKVPLESAAWASVAARTPWIFNGTPIIAEHSVDDDPFWPVQTARLTLANGRSVYGALQFRPGMELWSFCRSHEGADEVAVFDRIAHSVGAPNDTEIQINAERLAEERQRMSEVERTTMEAQRMRLQEFRQSARPSPAYSE
jgi:hypothetical protein